MSKCGEIKLRGILRMWGVPKKMWGNMGLYF
jgi:hypothetical protein